MGILFDFACFINLSSLSPFSNFNLLIIYLSIPTPEGVGITLRIGAEIPRFSPIGWAVPGDRIKILILSSLLFSLKAFMLVTVPRSIHLMKRRIYLETRLSLRPQAHGPV